MEDAGGKQTDIALISGSSIWRSMFDITPDGWGYVVRRKGQQQIFAHKSFTIFDEHMAARQYFDNENLRSPAQGWVGHRVFLWTVYANNRNRVPGRLLKGKGNPRKLDETDYGEVLSMYRRPPANVISNL